MAHKQSKQEITQQEEAELSKLTQKTMEYAEVISAINYVKENIKDTNIHKSSILKSLNRVCQLIVEG
jgi:hypothetical protein